MTGLYSKVSDIKKERIRKLTQEGLETKIMAQRLNITSSQIIYHQKKLKVGKYGERKYERTINC